MDKTEILKQLEELRKIFMGIKPKQSNNQNNQIEQIATHFVAVEKIEKEIAFFERKLENEEEYMVESAAPVFAEDSMFYRMQIEYSIKEAEEEQRDNEVRINAIQRKLELIPSKIKIAQDLQAENHAELGRIQASLSENPELKEQLSKRSEECRDYIQSISSTITSLDKGKEALEKKIENIQLRQIEIPEAISRYKELLTKFDEAHQKPSMTVDLDAMQTDRDQVNVLKAVLDSYGLQRLSLTYNFVEKVYDLANRYRSLRMNDVELKKELEIFKKLLPDEVSNYGAKKRQEKIKQNRTSQQYCATEMAVLEEKLQNKDNYRNSVSVQEGQRNVLHMQQNLFQMKNVIDKDSVYITNLLLEIEYDKEQIDTSKAMEKTYIDENLELGFTLAVVEENSKEDAQIKAALIKNRKKAAEQRTEQDTIAQHKTHLEELVLEIEKKVMLAKKNYDMEDKKLRAYKKMIERKEDINLTAVRIDEEKLESLKNDLQVLKSREFFLSQSDPRIKINTILDDLNKKMKKDAATKTVESTENKNPDSKKTGKEPAKKKKEKGSEKPLIVALTRLLPGKQKVDAYIPQPEHVEEQVRGKTLKDACIAIRDRFFTTKSWDIQDVKEQDLRGKIVDAEFSPIEETEAPIIEPKITSEKEESIVPPVEETKEPVVEEDVVPEKEEPNIPQEKKEEESTKPSNTQKVSIIDSAKVILYTKASEFLSGTRQSAADLFSKTGNWSSEKAQVAQMLNRPFILDKIEPGTLAKVFGKPVSEENAEDKLPKKPKEAVKKSDEEPVKDAPVFFGRGAGIGMPIPKKIQETSRKIVEGLKAVRESLQGDTNIMDAEFVVDEDTAGKGMGHGK